MLGKITISEKPVPTGEKYDFSQDGIYDYDLYVYDEHKKDFDSLLSEANVNKALKDFLKVIKMTPDFFKEALELMDNITNNKINIVADAEYVELDFELKDIKEYIKENPILKTKKIILPKIYSLSFESIREIENTFIDKSNIYIKLVGNIMPISIATFKKTLKKIDEIVINIKKLDLSPIEQIMFAYDIVKDKEYKTEDENESVHESRDLSLSLLGDKIVCAGYSNILKTILDKLGIKNSVYVLNDHQRNIAYVKDDKYEIDGVYYFDATGDSKITSNGNRHFDRYLFFAKTKDQIASYYEIEDTTLPCYDDLLTGDIYCDYMKEKGISGATPNLINTINKMSEFIDKKPLIPYIPLVKKDQKCGNNLVKKMKKDEFLQADTIELNKEEIEEKICDYLNLFGKEIKAPTMLKILYNVRKKQWYLDPEKYPFSEEDFAKSVLNSKWSFKEDDGDDFDIIKFIMEAKRKKPATEIIEEAQDYIEDKDIDRDIERIKTAKVLRRVLESKKQN